MLYPQARYFTPNGTCKNSICWNGPWNMSALAEGSLAVLELAVWLWGSCVVSCTPWAERGREMLLWQSDSRAVAAAACTISLRAQEGKKGGGGGGREERKKEREILSKHGAHVVECQCGGEIANHLFWMSQKVPYAYSCNICSMDENNNGQQASGQMCHQLMCPLMQERSQ